MLRTWRPRLGFAALAVALWAGSAQPAAAQQPPIPQQPITRNYQDGTVYGPATMYGPNGANVLAVQPAPQPTLPRFYYYPYYYYPHSYWPQNSPTWPEPKGHPYVRPPAYMAYPAFKEPGWRYELWTPMKYYRGSHFWLDQF